MAYTLKRSPGMPFYTLQVDGNDKFCPFVPPVLMRTKMNQERIVPAKCGTQCALFALDDGFRWVEGKGEGHAVDQEYAFLHCAGPNSRALPIAAKIEPESTDASKAN